MKVTERCLALMRAVDYLKTQPKSGRFDEMLGLLEEMAVLEEPGAGLGMATPQRLDEYRKDLTLRMVRLTPPPEVLRALRGV